MDRGAWQAESDTSHLGVGRTIMLKYLGVGKDRTLDDSRSNSSCEIDEKSKTKQQGY